MVVEKALKRNINQMNYLNFDWKRNNWRENKKHLLDSLENLNSAYIMIKSDMVLWLC